MTKSSYQKNRLKVLAQKRQYYLENKEVIDLKHKQWALEHKDEIRLKNKIYREINATEISEQRRKYRLTENKLKRREYQKEYMRKLLLNPQERLIHNLRRRLRGCLKGEIKASSTKNLVGCSLEQLKNHLESKFLSGMSWDNYGKFGWVIDHIKPCAKFDLSKPEEQFKCFNYTNLQPLWKIDNLRKWSK